jgi:hypothetical protein
MSSPRRSTMKTAASLPDMRRARTSSMTPSSSSCCEALGHVHGAIVSERGGAVYVDARPLV